MDYTYLLEEMANKNLTFNEISNENGVCVLNIICYHIETKHKYPFLQFMMDKVPYCNNIVKEQITFPYIFLRNDSSDIEEIVLGRVKSGLELLGCDYNKVTEDMFKGILFGENSGTPYALVNITGIDINGLNFMRQTTCWFVLPSEIINTKKVCNIDIDSEVTYLFIDIPYLGLLFNSKTNEPYMMPDAVYTGSEIKNAEFQSIFGNTKKKVYDSCGEYYFFYRSFSDAVKDGGWLNVRNPNKIGNRIIVDDNSNKYITGCINRYALFVEGKIYMEAGREFGITDDIIESLYPEPCIIICYSGEHEIKPDILVKNYESFVSLSYHKLNKNLLDESFVEENKKQYMIA
jgi:uncharacterized protein involved in tellurium resistance